MSDERVAIVVLFGMVVSIVLWLLWELSDKERKLHKLRNQQQTVITKRALAERKGMQDQVEELSADIAGQKLTLKNAPINTLATLATLIVVILLAYAFWTHQQDSKETGQAFVSAIKEQTGALKEQTIVMRKANCIQTYPGAPHEKDRACENLSR